MIDFNRLNRLAREVRMRSDRVAPPLSHALPYAAHSVEARDRGNGRDSGRSWYRIANANTRNAEIYLYDIIGEWGVTAGDFVNDLRSVRSESIDLHINCEGGEIFDGLAIYEALARHSSYTRGIVDGVAASSASFILQACDEREMAKRSRLMIHDGHGLMIGNAADMREMADLLDDLSDNIADIYAERAGGTRKQWRNAMLGPNRGSDGTWYDAQAAVTAGLADRIGDGRGASSSAEDRRRPVVVDREDLEDQPDAPARRAVMAGWDPKAFAALTDDATAEPAEPIDFSGLADLGRLINSDK